MAVEKQIIWDRIEHKNPAHRAELTSFIVIQPDTILNLPESNNAAANYDLIDYILSNSNATVTEGLNVPQDLEGVLFHDDGSPF